MWNDLDGLYPGKVSHSDNLNLHQLNGTMTWRLQSLKQEDSNFFTIKPNHLLLFILSILIFFILCMLPISFHPQHFYYLFFFLYFVFEVITVNLSVQSREIELSFLQYPQLRLCSGQLIMSGGHVLGVHCSTLAQDKINHGEY